MKIFAIDPSLTASGWCYADTTGRDIDVLDAGRVAGASTDEGDPVERAGMMRDALVETFLNKAKNNIVRNGATVGIEVVIEIPSGRVTARNTGGGSGLSVYGFCVGVIYDRFAMLFGNDCMHAPSEAVWTGSRSKKARKKIALEHFGALDKMKDPGMDISDAVALAVWWAQVGRHKRAGRRGQDDAATSVSGGLPGSC